MERIERRHTGSPRVPFLGVPVELGDDELPGGFEADAWDLGPGGLGLRSAFLPKIGSRLHCRFRNPADGTPIEARGEVVWADEAGPYEGAFGLRFDSLDGHSAEELDRLIGSVATVERTRRTPVEEPPEPALEAAPRAVEAAPEPEPAAEEFTSRLVQIELDGVAQGLTAELVHEAGDLVVLEQSLDFLTLGRRVRLEDGREGLVAAVDLRVDGEMPRLVMTLAVEETDDLEEPSRVAPIPAAERMAAAAPAFVDEPVSERARPEAFVAHAPSIAPLPLEEVVIESPRMATPPRAEVGDDSPFHAAVTDAHVGTWVERPGDREAHDDKAPIELLRESLARVRPLLVQLRAWFLAFLEKAAPIARRLFHTTKAKTGDVTSRLFAASRGAASRGVTRVRRFGDALPRTLREKRGDVKLPPRRPQRRVAGREVPMEARSRSRTQLVVGIGVFFALLFGAGLLFRSGDTELPAERVAEASDEAARPSAETTSSATSFGASHVPNAMIFDLVLESAATRLEGSEIEDGVVIRVLGGRSVSRAGAIAANHPDVEYAAIRNLDGAAELELRFVPGRTPVYRVELRGSILRVEIMP